MIGYGGQPPFKRLFLYCPRPLINKPPPLNRDYKREPNTRALKRRGFMNHGSTLFLGLILHSGQSKGVLADDISDVDDYSYRIA